MKSKTTGLLLLILVAIAIAMPGLSQKMPSVAKEKIYKQRVLPIVDFLERQANDAKVFSKQKEKASRYDRQSSQPIQEAYMVSGRVWSTAWSKDLTALPFNKSDVVLIGGVMGSRAHLSNDKTGIYSEFEVQVEEILKDNVKESVHPGTSIYLERFGGAVRFSSGVIQRYETTGQGMPTVGQRYLFFLKRINGRDFEIVTGYQFDGELVAPLDGSIVEEGKGRYPFDVYQGSDVSTFLRTVRTLANQQPSS